jgi:hypothetical protein
LSKASQESFACARKRDARTSAEPIHDCVDNGDSRDGNVSVIARINEGATQPRAAWRHGCGSRRADFLLLTLPPSEVARPWFPNLS